MSPFRPCSSSALAASKPSVPAPPVTLCMLVSCLWGLKGEGRYIAFPETENRCWARWVGVRFAGAGSGGEAIELASPVLKTIWGRIREVRASRSVIPVVADAAMIV